VADRAITSISLNDVRELIDEKNIGEHAADAVGRLLGLVIALAPVIGGPALLPLWALIEPKNELIEVVKDAARKISKSKPADYLDRIERMAAANCLLVYAAYFDALRQHWPSIIRSLPVPEEEVKKALSAATERASASPSDRGSVADQIIQIPHPVGDGIPGKIDRFDIFLQLTDLVVHPLREIGHPDAGWLDELRAALADRAEALYQAEYLGMAVEFQQFFIWGVLQDRAAKTGQIQELAEDQRTWFELTGRAMHSLDLGLKELAEAIAQLPRHALTSPALGSIAQREVQAVAEGLHWTYADVLQEQVIDDQFTVHDAGPRISFPRKLDGFVPQAYRVALYQGKDTHLEREDAWRERNVQADIGAFIMRYLESPYSAQTPLLILGHPGSGKSLLTEVLAGHLAYPTYTTVRVKLRDVDPDVGLLTQLERQIQGDTGGRFIRWADFADGLSMSPPVVILDGYDELLQATGKVFASYLDELRQFQHQQAVQRRPVRVIITSRLTLIDKAAIPSGTTVVKLEEFDEVRRCAWCEVWNRHNEPYFRQARIKPFAVPDNEKLLELARQPLLLLMLAIYDSLDNELSSQPDIDQTLLYEKLLRRFIERELSKGKAGREFAALPDTDRTAAIDWELGRLGVAAIGMFNRQDVKIHREELNSDLCYFGAEKAATADGRVLGEADLLHGSFFFIHESRSKLQDEPAGPGDGQAAFEFLHNTFGEFLAADFILRRAVEEAGTICRLSGDTMLGDTRVRRLAMLRESWFGCLVHTALHSRPVILDMIGEWGEHRLGDDQWSRANVLAAFDAIVAAQLRTVLNDLTISDPEPRQRSLSPYAPLPMRGHLAVYSLNLVLLRAYLGNENYVLDEEALGDHPDSCRPWDGLANLWRSWFTLDSLSALAKMVTATRLDHHRIEIAPYESRLIPSSRSPLEDSYRSAVALADNLTAASSALNIAPTTRMPRDIFHELWGRVGNASPELDRAAGVLALKMFAANGDELRVSSRVTPGAHPGFPLYLTRFPETEVEYAAVVVRLTHTPLQWRLVLVHQGGFSELVHLSRYQAETAVDALVKLEPSWLPNLLAESRGNWDRFLQSPAAAPVLRAAARELVPMQFDSAVNAARMNLQGQIDALDVDTASALAVLSCLGGSSDLCARTLDAIIEKCEAGDWRPLDIPVGTWERLANLFRSTDLVSDTHRGRFLVLVEAAVAESFESFKDDEQPGTHALAPFWVQALRIGAVGNMDRILKAIERWLGPRIPEYIAGRELKCIMSLIGWAHECSVPSLALHVLRIAGDGAWLSRFLHSQPDRWNPDGVDDDSVASILTHKEAMDLRWALGLLHQADKRKAENSAGLK